jgi:hypothetical protein
MNFELCIRLNKSTVYTGQGMQEPQAQAKVQVKPRGRPPIVVSGPCAAGGGMIAGLETWRIGDKFVLVDRSSDGRFAEDVATWNAAAGLNATAHKKLKDATK